MDSMHDEIAEIPKRMMIPIYIYLILTILLWVTLSLIHNEIRISRHNEFVDGVRRGLKAYSTTYDMSNANLKLLSEGYLTVDDLDPSKYNMSSNNIRVNNSESMKKFTRILSGNTTIPKAEIESYKGYVVQVFTEYKLASGLMKPTYSVELYKVGSTTPTTIKVSDLRGVETFIEQQTGTNVDIYSTLNPQVHREQEYDRKNTYSTGNKVVSSYNTYMYVGKDIPIKGIFNTGQINIVEMQTYSTLRQGVTE